MARRKKHTPEQVVSLLRQIEVAVADGKTAAQASKEALISEQTYYRCRKQYGELQVDQAQRLKELKQENAKLKRLVADLGLDKLVLKDIASGNFSALNDGVSPHKQRPVRGDPGVVRSLMPRSTA
jgi:putative transposase